MDGLYTRSAVARSPVLNELELLGLPLLLDYDELLLLFDGVPLLLLEELDELEELLLGVPFVEELEELLLGVPFLEELELLLLLLLGELFLDEDFVLTTVFVFAAVFAAALTDFLACLIIFLTPALAFLTATAAFFFAAFFADLILAAFKILALLFWSDSSSLAISLNLFSRALSYSFSRLLRPVLNILFCY